MDKQRFYDGKLFDAYRYMGAHKVRQGYQFMTFAPNAKKIALVGDFNGWKEEWMESDHGFFTRSVETAELGQMYKYRIYSSDTDWVEHTDPYAFQMERRPGCCAVITDISAYRFNDRNWMKRRTVGYEKPINIYEMHFGSWKANAADENGWFRYDELADLLIPYLKANHFTHVEFLPLMEHPFDGSWGYQGTGFFAPSSRYGEPKHLMELIDRLHQENIGAILDFVPVHFAIDSYGLRNYDGTSIYEYPHGDVTESEWGTCNFNYARREAQCFMQSAAHFWLKEYHFDGLRMDAISRMIYWLGDEKRGINPNSFEFLKQMNGGLKKLHPTAMLIAEDSSAYPGVTRRVEDGGLGFDYKWSLGWMHDTLEFFQLSPKSRVQGYHKLTFATSYFDKERYLLPFSHDENVHGKGTILQKMNGVYEDKFAQAKALYLFMMVHPGKKLNFMGYELGQLREWDESREQDWDILKYPTHDSFHKYIAELNRLYLSLSELHKDYINGNFVWLDCEQNEHCIYSLARYTSGKGIVAIFNFTDKENGKYVVSIPYAENVKLLLHTDWEAFGGKTRKTESRWESTQVDGTRTLNMIIPAFSGMLFRFAKTSAE